MVTDHTQANQDLEPIARQIGVQRPTELDAKHRRLSERLSTLQAQEFDREYLKEMVEAHRTWSRRVGRSPTTPPRHRIGLRREVRRREVRRSAPAAAAG
jgi:putative membrane protein